MEDFLTGPISNGHGHIHHASHFLAFGFLAMVDPALADKQPDLLGFMPGTPNTRRASEALDALFLRNKPSHRLTITSCSTSGSRSHTLYAMFPAEVCFLPKGVNPMLEWQRSCILLA